MLISCKQGKKETETGVSAQAVDVEIQGHRGERGYMPENSIAGFIQAIKDSVDVIEMDVVISADSQVVVSHESFMSSKYVSMPSGEPVSSENEKELNLYKMTYDSIRKFEAGKNGNPDFPDQQRLSTYKPLLKEVIDSVEGFIAKNNLNPVGYNIEIKSSRPEYGKFQPQPEEFVQMVMKVVIENNIEGPVNIQSFDPEILNLMHRKFPEMKLAFLVSQPGIDKNLGKLNFIPEIYSPNYQLVRSEKFVDSIHSKTMRLIPWTVDDTLAIKEMLRLKVDGIITDYPERVLDLIEHR